MPLFRRACFVFARAGFGGEDKLVRSPVFRFLCSSFYSFGRFVYFCSDVHPVSMAWLQNVSTALVCLFQRPSPQPGKLFQFSPIHQIDFSKYMARFYSLLLVYFLVLHRPCLPMYFVPPAELSRSGSVHQSEAHSTPCTLDLR